MQMDSPKPKRHCSESDSVNSSTTKTLVSKLSSTPSLHAEERILNKRYLLGNNVSGKEICAEKLVGQSQLSQSQPCMC